MIYFLYTIGKGGPIMNIIWSKYIQGVKTLYFSRRLRFHDMFAEQYQALFDLSKEKQLKILEIGCGPGALASALHRWYPNAEITGLDRDSAFIQFAGEHEPGISFVEGDAAKLPYPDNTFDVTISFTVSEHIDPSAFFQEQLRVLKPGGVCLVLSSRKGITVPAPVISDSDREQRFWDKAGKYDHTKGQYEICRYPMSEAELPLAMESYGFQQIHTGFVTVSLTPDNPDISSSLAYDMINASRQTELDSIESVCHSIPEQVSPEERDEMIRLINEKYDRRLHQYDQGEKQWDTNVSLIMVVRGVK